MNRLVLAPLLLLSAAGCGTDPIECGTPPDLTGTWAYSATAPDAIIAGTLTITDGGSCVIEGAIAVTVDDGDGSPSLLDGGVSGLFLNSTTFDLTADLGGARRHLGSVVADTLAGNWSQPTGGSPLTGTFRAVRSTP